MLRFQTFEGKLFTCDYQGTIYCVDYGNDIIAICHAAVSTEDLRGEKDNEDATIAGSPREWDNWELVFNVAEEQEGIYKRAISNAYCAMELLQRLLVET